MTGARIEGRVAEIVTPRPDRAASFLVDEGHGYWFEVIVANGRPELPPIGSHVIAIGHRTPSGAIVATAIEVVT